MLLSRLTVYQSRALTILKNRDFEKYCGTKMCLFALEFLVCIAILAGEVESWRSVTHLCVPGFHTTALTPLFFTKPLATFLGCIRGERRKLEESLLQPDLQGRVHQPFSRTFFVFFSKIL